MCSAKANIRFGPVADQHALLTVSGPGVEQRCPVHWAFWDIDQFRIDLHLGGLALRPDISDWLGPVHVVERARPRHLDQAAPGHSKASRGNARKKVMAMTLPLLALRS